MFEERAKRTQVDTVRRTVKVDSGMKLRDLLDFLAAGPILAIYSATFQLKLEFCA